MQLTAGPADLRAAAAALDSSAGRLADSADTFAARARLDAPELGRSAAGAAGQATQATEQAVTVVVEDIQQLSRALRLLAELYQRLDDTAMPR